MVDDKALVSVPPEGVNPPTTRVQVFEHGLAVHVYRVTDYQLAQLASGGNWKVAGIGLLSFFGATFLSFLTAILTAPPLSRVKLDFLLIVLVVSAFASVASAVALIIGARQTKNLVDAIKESSTP